MDHNYTGKKINEDEVIAQFTKTLTRQVFIIDKIIMNGKIQRGQVSWRQKLSKKWSVYRIYGRITRRLY